MGLYWPLRLIFLPKMAYSDIQGRQKLNIILKKFKKKMNYNKS